MLSNCESQYYVMYGAGAVFFFRLRQKSAKELAPAPQRWPQAWQAAAHKHCVIGIGKVQKYYIKRVPVIV